MEVDVLGVAPHHSKRVACVAGAIAERAGLSRQERFDLAGLALLHDNGIAEAVPRRRRPSAREPGADLQAVEGFRDHCEAGERMVHGPPFEARHRDVIRFHHENHDGSGFYGRAGSAIPPLSRIIRAADALVFAFDPSQADGALMQQAREFVASRRGSWFSPEVADALAEVVLRPPFWLDLREENIARSVRKCSPALRVEMSYARLRELTKTFSRIIDSKSSFTSRHSGGLAEKAARLASRAGWSGDDTAQLLIAADLHDIGKLVVPDAILEKAGALDAAEREIVQTHTYYTRMVLSEISGFERITEWASNHHERLDGSGYPLGRRAEGLDDGSRLLAALDSYQAMTEDRPYRPAIPHEAAVGALRDEAARGRLDSRYVEEIGREFG